MCVCRRTSSSHAGKQHQNKGHPKTHKKTYSAFFEELTPIFISFTPKLINNNTDHPSEMIQTKTEPLQNKKYSTKSLF